jgi:putative intracellular protease/amidase
MKPNVCLLVFDGFADWEPAHALCEMRRSGKFNVVTVGFSSESVTSMAGLRISPDMAVAEIDVASTAFFMLPGGDMWQDKSDVGIAPLLRRLHEANVWIGAICAATLEMARAGLTRGIRHTSNSKSYLEAMVSGYRDGDFYVDELAVTNQNVITASGLGSVEFAREVLRSLQVYSDPDIDTWFDMFKRGVIPARVT